MIHRTFSDVKPELARVAGNAGMAVTDARFLVRLNKAIEELMDAGDWPGVVDRYRFRVYDGTITLPGDLLRVVGIASNNVPVELRSPWYEFVEAGPGPQEGYGWLDVAIDRGEVATFQNIPLDGTEYRLHVYGEVDERVDTVRPKIRVHCYGASGQWARSVIGGEWDDGIELEINGDTAPKRTVSSIGVTGVAGVIKPETRGYVHLHATNGTDTIHLATYAPRETVPSYRQYFLPNIRPSSTDNAVLVRARKRFIPITKDKDLLLISNINALELMILAQNERAEGNVDTYLANRTLAIGLMKEGANAYHGRTRKPALSMSRSFGLGVMPHVR